MSSTDSFSSGIGGRLDFRKNRNLYTYLVCVLIAGFFWLLNSLNKEYTTEIELPLKYRNLPDNFVFEDNMPRQVSAQVKGYGFNILFYSASRESDSVLIDFQQAKRAHSDGGMFYKLPTNGALKGHLDRVPSNVQLIKFWEDTLFIQVEIRRTKSLPLKAQLKLGFERQHVQDGPIEIEPANVTVNGPASIVDQLDFIALKPIELQDLNSDISIEAEVLLPEGVSVGREKATIFIPVDQTSEVDFEVALEQRNVPDSLEMLIFPSKVQVVCELPLSKFEILNYRDLVLSVDYLGYENGKTRLPVKVESKPDYVQVKKIDPKRVEVVVKK